MGFYEESPEQVRQNIEIRGGKLISKVNNAEYIYGELWIPTLGELREEAPDLETFKDKIRVWEVVDDVQNLHKRVENNLAMFQVASQFNLLEMVDPYVTPEEGISIYENDFTQGPACAIACAAGTIYRNYFVEIDGQIGQTEDRQIDCMEEIASELQNDRLQLWHMQNGYLMTDRNSLMFINDYLNSLSEFEYMQLRDLLKIGIQWNTEVTLEGTDNLVSQAYCSALPISYHNIEVSLWEPFARFVLEATYEAVFYAALINYERNGSEKLFLTLVGGGAFGNPKKWILDAIDKALQKFRNTPLDVYIVSYRYSDPDVAELVDKYNA